MRRGAARAPGRRAEGDRITYDQLVRAGNDCRLCVDCPRPPASTVPVTDVLTGCKGGRPAAAGLLTAVSEV